ncbi:fibulin-2 [Aplochiton taeniatus]
MNVLKLSFSVCYFILCLDICLSQKDCTGIKCPLLQNCIEEVLGKRACCATCIKTGCTCEGYQYYDCVHAGFRNGKVPEGESYFVDFGSTECSCPTGGGRIGCRFIPCPDIPSNCIAVAQPADGCQQCLRVGCVHGNEKYEAGHSFRMEPCQVCHCPNDGGSLMCSPIPDCDPRRVKRPVPPSSTASGNSRRVSNTRDNRQASPTDPFFKVSLGKTLPLYKQDTPSPGTEEGYDFTQTDPTPSTPQEVIQTLESKTEPPAYPEPSLTPSVLDRSSGQELREKRTGAYDHQTRDEADYLLLNTEQTYNRAEGQTSIASTTTATTTQKLTAQSPRQQQDIERGVRHDSDREIKNTTARDGRFDEEVRHGDPLPGHAGGRGPMHQSHGRLEKGTVEQHKRQAQREPEHGTFPMVQFSPTSRPPVRVKGEGEQPRRQSLTLGMFQNSAGGSEVSAKELVDVCCEKGEKWASANGHCNNMVLPREDRHSICWTAQKQCCLGSLRDSRCFSGMNVARDGGACEENASDRCGADSYQECCSCCSLGLRVRSEGHRCEAQQYLGYPCSHIFLTCCQGEEEREAGEQREGGDGWHTVRERPSLGPTPAPKRVSDSPFPKEAFSIGGEGEQDTANTAEGPPLVEDVDECQVYPDVLCHHRCVNAPGSYRCECYPGYVLQADAFTCAQEPLDEENGLKEEERGAAEASVQPPPPPTALPAVPLDPCEGNGPCMQQCRPQAGRPHCSCFRGFSLMADGYSCEDVNECLSPRACLQSERCVNAAGSYACQRPIMCPRGYQVNNDICEDIDECAQMSHTCGLGLECVNTEGSFRCSPRLRCSAGFTQDAQGNCIDIDECASGGQPCSPGYNCVNTVGSYSCQRKIMICSRGYHASPDGSRCIDVDECQASLHRCGEGQLCHNLPGSYRCDCQTGYQYDMFRKTCVDVNECWRYPGRLCAQTCENTPGSYQCSCTAGFRLAADGKNCEDVNECLTNPCSQECANVYGSYQCYCNQGYHLSGDGHHCEDIDECTQSMGHLCTYKCVNVPGSYQCACPEYGYTMSPNGHSCRDVDECAAGAYNCSLAETCFNIQGGYRCLSFDCPPNYRRVSDTRCERIGCPNHLDCQNSPLRITYYHLSFQSNIVIPAQIFRIGPSPAYSGDDVIVSVTRGNEENYFSTRKLNAYTGAVYLHRQVREPQDFLVDVEMKLWRQGTFTTFQARIYVFITANSL